MRLSAVLPVLSLIVGCVAAPPPNDTAAGDAPDRVQPGAGCPAPSSNPAAGRIAGKPFTVEASTIEAGVLELRQGDDFVPDRALSVFLFLDEGEIPADRSFEFDETAAFGAPHVHMNWKGEGSEFESEVFPDGYRLRLSFDAERDDVLPGTIHLCLPDEANSWVSGTFEATIKGFRLIDGSPDLSQDALKNFEYLALNHLRSSLGTEIEIESVERGRYTHAGSSGPQVGSADVTFLTRGERRAGRFLFVKLENRWRVDKLLEMDQLAEAHPYREPTEARFVHAQLAWVVAREIEERVRARHPGSAVYPGNDFSVVETYSANDDQAQVQASYRLDDSSEKVVLQLALERAADGWTVTGNGSLD